MLPQDQLLAEFNNTLEIFRRDVCIKLRCFPTLTRQYSEKVKIRERIIFEKHDIAMSLSEDIEYSSMILRDLYSEVIDDLLNQRDLINPTESSIIVSGKFIVALKSFMFFVRAYYDSLYEVSWHLLTHKEQRGIRPKEGMMWLINEDEKSFKFDTVVTSKLNSEIPDFVSWFLKMRKIRNDIKTLSGGTNHSIHYLNGEVFMSFKIKDSTLDLRSITDILKMTIRVTQTVLEVGKDSLALRAKTNTPSDNSSTRPLD